MIFGLLSPFPLQPSHHESLAPIFTPCSVSASESNVSLAQQIDHEIPVQTFSVEQTKEAFDVARNSIERLTTVIPSSPQQDALKVFKMCAFATTKPPQGSTN
ncbi:unnamed protein product [Ilex paraguariensis]|uniref:Uncharacterized protein n=1 Tax=Ilex paraguariensis TaxID=185542 RepID=A0ABC8SZL6_9AQUA